MANKKKGTRKGKYTIRILLDDAHEEMFKALQTHCRKNPELSYGAPNQRIVNAAIELLFGWHADTNYLFTDRHAVDKHTHNCQMNFIAYLHDCAVITDKQAKHIYDQFFAPERDGLAISDYEQFVMKLGTPGIGQLGVPFMEPEIRRRERALQIYTQARMQHGEPTEADAKTAVDGITKEDA